MDPFARKQEQRQDQAETAMAHQDTRAQMSGQWTIAGLEQSAFVLGSHLKQPDRRTAGLNLENGSRRSATVEAEDAGTGRKFTRTHCASGRMSEGMQGDLMHTRQ